MVSSLINLSYIWSCTSTTRHSLGGNNSSAGKVFNTNEKIYLIKLKSSLRSITVSIGSSSINSIEFIRLTGVVLYADILHISNHLNVGYRVMNYMYE